MRISFFIYQKFIIMCSHSYQWSTEDFFGWYVHLMRLAFNSNLSFDTSDTSNPFINWEFPTGCRYIYIVVIFLFSHVTFYCIKWNISKLNSWPLFLGQFVFEGMTKTVFTKILLRFLLHIICYHAKKPQNSLVYICVDM